MDKLNLPAGCSYGNRTKRPLIFSHSVQCLSGSLSILIGLKLIYSPLFCVSHFISKIYKLGYHFYSVSLKQYRQHLDKTSSVQKPKGVHSHGLLTGARASRLSSGGSSCVEEGMVGTVPHVSVRK